MNALILPENELIVVKQLPIIQEQLREIKSRVDETVSETLAMECTEDTVKIIKEKRSELNKLAAAFEDKRKEVKKAVLSPYEDFEAVYKECVIDAFKHADGELKRRIAVVEDGVKDRKQEEVEAYFAEYAENLNIDFITFPAMNIKITLSDSVKKLKEQVKTALDKINADVTMINTLQDADEIMAEYKRTYDASNAIQTVHDRHKAIEDEKRRSEERRQAEATRIETERLVREKYEQIKKEEAVILPPVEKPIETVGKTVDKIEPQPIYSATFTVQGTIEQLKALKEFLINGGYKYDNQ